MQKKIPQETAKEGLPDDLISKRNIVIIYHKEEKPLAYLKLTIEDSQFRETSTNQHSNEKHHK